MACSLSGSIDPNRSADRFAGSCYDWNLGTDLRSDNRDETGRHIAQIGTITG